MAPSGFVIAARSLRKSPVFALTAITTLALGIGAATAIYSVVDGVLLRPLPYHDSARLVVASEELRKRGVNDWLFSNPDFLDLRDGTAHQFASLAAVSTATAPMLDRNGMPEEVRLAQVTPNFFRLMGAKIVLGRNFDQTDGRAPAHRIAVISHEYFERHFGADPSIVGKPISRPGGSGPIVAGVLEPGFELLFPPGANIERQPDIWTAEQLPYDNAERLLARYWAVGRLRDGVSVEQAQSAAEAVAAELRSRFALSQTADLHFNVVPFKQHLVAAVRPTLLVLAGAAIFLLLIACANIANLMLVRMSMREHDLAIRASLGGSWAHLAWQPLAEAFLLATAGTVMGIALAWGAIRILLWVAPANLPRLAAVSVDSSALLFAAASGFIAAAVFAALPVARTVRPNLATALGGAGRTSGLACGGWLRNAVVVAEGALCFVLLIGSGLMLRSFTEIERVPLGFDPKALLTLQLQGPLSNTAAGRAAFTREIWSSLHNLPGVQSVTASTPFPLTGNFHPIRWGTAESLADNSKFQAADEQLVLPGYFESMRTPLLAGRGFTDADNRPDRNVAVVDEVLARKAFPHEPAVGKQILIRLRTPQPEWVQIIGVVTHQRNESLIEPGREQIYFTDGFFSHGAVQRWALRVSGDPSRYVEPVRRTLGRINPNLLMTKVQPMEFYVSLAQANTRFALILIASLAAVSAILSAVGLYGVLSTLVRQRTAEIGVRMAVGAEPWNIFGLIAGNGLRLGFMGVTLGTFAAWGLTRWLVSLLVNVKPNDPFTFVFVAGLFLAVVVLASWIPARRAARLDPTVALREG